MNRAKLLIKNFFAYGFAEFISKIVPFLCLPLVTRLMPDTAAFGVFNMYTVVSGISVTLIVLNMHTAVFRDYFLSKPEDTNYDITTTGQRIVLFNSLIICLILIVFNQFFSRLFFNDVQYSLVIVFSAIAIFFTANNYLIELPTRLQNQRRIFIISKLISSVGYYAVILFLIYIGFTYYSIIFGAIFTAIFLMAYFWIKNKDFFLEGKFDRDIAKSLYKTGVPLMPASIMYWLYSGISVILISRFLDLNELGVYSFGSKIARISQILATVLIGGLTHFIYSTLKDKDYKTMIGKLWEIMFVFSTIFYLVLFLLKDFIFNTFFTGDYLQGIVVFPYLLLVPLLSFLKFFFLTQFTIIGKPIYHFVIYFIDCALLFALSLLLLPDYGIVGVAIANVCSSYVSLTILIVLAVIKKKLIVFQASTYFLFLLFLFVFIFINSKDTIFLNQIMIFGYMAVAFLMNIKRIYNYFGVRSSEFGVRS
ncbi:MAG: oligosaccharide flippase family protein [Candidatus Cloacimonetes bacterium]|nr:oligosaccharide flippase family protein [Candidatus Cloacimonadota bacterium]